MKFLELGSEATHHNDRRFRFSDEWTTMGLSKTGKPDVRRDIEELPWPFPDNTFLAVFASHILEHTIRPRLVLEEILRVLIPGGTARVLLPDASFIVKQYVDRNITIEKMTTLLRELEPYGHKSPFDKRRIRRDMQSVGFENVSILNPYKSRVSEMRENYFSNRIYRSLICEGSKSDE